MALTVNDFDCLLCWADAFLHRTDSPKIREQAHAFAAECGGAPAQLDHYAWEHQAPGNADADAYTFDGLDAARCRQCGALYRPGAWKWALWQCYPCLRKGVTPEDY